ncbi:hypothetical protein C5708_09270 [Caulobacter sp. CCUG 60055]|uniref:hypothetical protein n=1 Tax=Caulobacter sp. CCUG 60055 TaxID=2100090 RepID=UPI001FA77F97|nr:hypothetical protein [Caulobacter sp. CCUG 60055]MCI3180443.1 hypothetical protein [Caulobacter sp. CCUG 60055]
MGVRSIILGGAALLTLAAPMTALADPGWGGHDGWRDRGWREHEWREHERWERWRDRDRDRWRWRGYYGYPPPVYYAPRCYIENQGYYNWYGEYVYRPVRVCR